MRLTEHEQKTIRDVVLGFDPAAKIFLYGSRAHDQLKGGDIDLLIITERLGFSEKISILSALKQILGEQKIDLLLKKNAELSSDAFVQQILQDSCAIE